MLNLAAIEARAAAATEGPWEVTLQAGPIWCVTSGNEDLAVTRWPSPDSRANAIFMVASRTDVPALIARIRELEAENAKIDDLDEALRQRDREILGLRRDRDARDARIAELEGDG